MWLGKGDMPGWTEGAGDGCGGTQQCPVGGPGTDGDGTRDERAAGDLSRPWGWTPNVTCCGYWMSSLR